MCDRRASGRHRPLHGWRAPSPQRQKRSHKSPMAFTLVLGTSLTMVCVGLCLAARADAAKIHHKSMSSPALVAKTTSPEATRATDGAQEETKRSKALHKEELKFRISGGVVSRHKAPHQSGQTTVSGNGFPCGSDMRRLSAAN